MTQRSFVMIWGTFIKIDYTEFSIKLKNILRKRGFLFASLFDLCYCNKTTEY